MYMIYIYIYIWYYRIIICHIGIHTEIKIQQSSNWRFRFFGPFFGPSVPMHLRMGVKGRAELCGDEDLGYLSLPSVDLANDAWISIG